MTDANKPVWLITGANKGLGLAVAKEALNRGFCVVAGARRVEQIHTVLETSENLRPVALDITRDDQVAAAVKAALDRFGRIDVLVNNAGYGVLGYFEEMSEAQVRQQMETNVFGTMKLTREVLPSMRHHKSGWIINLSSTSGIRAVGGGSVYSASKFAIEGWTEGLAMELAPFGIRCLIAEPGPFRTDFSNEKASMVFADKKLEAYQADREKLEAVFHNLNGNQPGDPAKFAKAIMTVVHDDRPPLRLVCGKASVKGIGEYLTTRQNEIEAWRNLSESTDF
jgi:NAD(P)-dependent dehydrogenase (short-subunit alcohol dehydrogenase family)